MSFFPGCREPRCPTGGDRLPASPVASVTPTATAPRSPFPRYTKTSTVSARLTFLQYHQERSPRVWLLILGVSFGIYLCRTILGFQTPAVQKQNGMEVSWKMSPPPREKRARGCCRSDQRPRVQLRHCVQLSCTRGRRRRSRLGCRLRTPRRKRRSRGTSSWCTASLERVRPGWSTTSRQGAIV